MYFETNFSNRIFRTNFLKHMKCFLEQVLRNNVYKTYEIYSEIEFLE